MGLRYTSCVKIALIRLCGRQYSRTNVTTAWKELKAQLTRSSISLLHFPWYSYVVLTLLIHRGGTVGNASKHSIAQLLATQPKAREPQEGRLSLHLLEQVKWVPSNRWVIIRESAGTSVLSQPWDWPSQAALARSPPHTPWSRALVSAQCSPLRTESVIILFNTSWGLFLPRMDVTHHYLMWRVQKWLQEQFWGQHWPRRTCSPWLFLGPVSKVKQEGCLWWHIFLFYYAIVTFLRW